MSSDPYRLEGRRVRAAFDAAASGYDAVAVVQAEVRARLLERLELFRLQPRRILDAGCGTGHGSRALLRHYRRAGIVALDLAPAMLAQARRQLDASLGVDGCRESSAKPFHNAPSRSKVGRGVDPATTLDLIGPLLTTP